MKLVNSFKKKDFQELMKVMNAESHVIKLMPFMKFKQTSLYSNYVLDVNSHQLLIPPKHMELKVHIEPTCVDPMAIVDHISINIKSFVESIIKAICEELALWLPPQFNTNQSFMNQDNFYSVDRNTEADKWGVRKQFNNDYIGTIQDAMCDVITNGGNPGIVIVPPNIMNKIMNELSAQFIPTNFNQVTIHGPKGSVPVVSYNCITNTYILDPATTLVPYSSTSQVSDNLIGGCIDITMLYSYIVALRHPNFNAVIS